MTDADTETETDIDDNEPDMSELAERVIDELDPGQTIGDKIVLSRRQVMAIAGGGLSLGALGTFGVSDAQAQSAVGTIGTASSPVDVEAASVNAGSVNTDDLNNTQWVESGESIQTAVNDAGAGGTVFVLPGTYNESVTLSAGQKLIGTGGVEEVEINGGDKRALDIANRCKVEGISFRTTSAGDDAVVAFANRYRILDCKIIEAPDDGINTNGSLFSIRGVEFVSGSIGGNDIRIQGGGNNNTIVGNISLTNIRNGGTGNEITGNS